MSTLYPIAGQQYTTKSGDTLKTIAACAYGSAERWPLLAQAFRKRTKTTYPWEVNPGETINIPVDINLNAAKRGT